MYGRRRDAVPGRLSMPKHARQKSVQAARELRRSATPSEAILWQRLRGRRLGGLRFRRQSQIGPYIVDFCCASHRPIIEIDGSVHESQVEEDRQRQSALEARGYRFLRFRAEDVESDPDAVIRHIEATLKESHT